LVRDELADGGELPGGVQAPGIRDAKRHPTFADALAVVRKELWDQEQNFYGLPAHTDTVKVPRAFVERLAEADCYAA
jgi:hypothetical protein